MCTLSDAYKRRNQRGKSARDIENQRQRIANRALETGNRKRLKRVNRVADRYSRNIYEAQGSPFGRAFDASRKVSRRTYMGNVNG